MDNGAPVLYPALHYQRAERPGEEGTLRCLLCPRACLIPEGGRGFCQVRLNSGGALFSLNYGYPGAISLDPVEKKPLYHFFPGSRTLSFGAPGCNFDCLGCQNHSLSRPGPLWPGQRGPGARPEDLARLARAQKARSLSFTYSEPTVFYEFAKEAAQAGSRLGLPSIWVTNGYMGPAVMEELGSLAAMNIDLKGYSQEFYRKVAKGSLEPVKQNIARAAKLGIWLEVTTLLIPGWNDSDEELNGLAAFLFSVSPELPWHISRFVPHRHQSDVRPTPIALLERARDIGKEAGLSYVYLGNVSGPGYADTFCPHCRRPLVRREDFGIISCFLGEGGHCPDCGKLIAGRWD